MNTDPILAPRPYFGSQNFTIVGESIMSDSNGDHILALTAADTQEGHAGLWPKWTFFGHKTLQMSLNSSVGEPFDAPISELLAPIQMYVQSAIDPRTGVFEGNFYATGYPSFQFFLNSKNILNMKQGKSGWSILKRQSKHVSIQVCDPEK